MVPVFYLYMHVICLDMFKDACVNPVKVSMQHVHVVFDFVVVWPLVTLHCCCAVAIREEKLVCIAAWRPDLQV